MSIFKCSRCGCAENTALCRYWYRKSRGLALLCSECDPDIGKWHGRFPKKEIKMEEKIKI